MPSISIDNKIVFSLYEKGKYTLAIINEAQFIDENIGYSNNNRRSDFLSLSSDNDEYYLRPTSRVIDYGVNTKLKPYKNKMTGPFLIPRLSYDLGTFRQWWFGIRIYGKIFGFSWGTIVPYYKKMDSKNYDLDYSSKNFILTKKDLQNYLINLNLYI